MNTKDLPIVEPNLTQRGEMDNSIIKMAMLDLFKQFRERKVNSCSIDIKYENKLITFKVLLENVIEDEIKDTSVLHLNDIKKEGE